jgi:hypothetical protein
VSNRIAELVGTISQPELALTFDRNDKHPVTGENLMMWVKALPGRRWDGRNQRWCATALGSNPEQTIKAAGFELVLDGDDRHASLQDILSLADLIPPLVKQSSARPAVALVRMRFSGFDRTRELLGAGGTWDKENQRFEIRLADLVTENKSGRKVVDRRMEFAGDTAENAIMATLVEAPTDASLAEAAASTAMSTGLDMTENQTKAMQKLIDDVGDIPDWFGMALYPYQRLGAIAAATGRYLLADSPGLGKTRQALATACIKGAHRTVIIVPPVVVTHWGREVEESGLNANCHGDITIFHARKKEPALPDRGVVVIPDSLLVSRPALAAAIIEWNPDFFIYDEAHRARNWTSKRSKVVRDLTDALEDGVPRICITGTPIFSTPQELAPILAMTGHLDPVFGGYANFLQTYCRKNHFDAWVPRKNMLPQLRQMLAEHVWVRRLKKDVLKDLPKKSRVAQFVDVDLKGYRTAHDEVVEKLMVYLADFHAAEGRFPSDEENEAWAKTQIGVISPLRKAAGVAKVPHALEEISNWVDANTLEKPAPDGSLYDRPYLVWAHHGEVIDALKEGIDNFPSTVKTAVEIIDGATSVSKRGQIVDDFQAGKIGVLIASITAAGVGITLTRGSDMVFVETDWTPALVSQAEDRELRIGQTQPVICRTLIAEGTLDERIQHVLTTKAETLNEVLGGDEADVAVMAAEASKITPSEIVMNLLGMAKVKVKKELGLK